MIYPLQHALRTRSYQIRTGFPYPAALLATALFVGGVSVTTLWHKQVDYPVSSLVNIVARAYPPFDYLVLASERFDHLEGIGLVSMLWYLWFKCTEPDSRIRIVTSLVGAACAAAASRLLQLLFPTHPRPLHDPNLQFLVPYGAKPQLLSYWHSFPSDHAALFFALAASIYLLDRNLGLLAMCGSIILGLGRIYEGYHFASDVFGGAGLGILIICLAQAASVRSSARWVMELERSRAPMFYMLAFILTYQISTLFDDVRSAAADYAKVFLSHAPTR